MSDQVIRQSRGVWVDGEMVFVTVSVNIDKIAKKLAYKAVRNASKKAVVAFGAVSVTAPDKGGSENV